MNIEYMCYLATNIMYLKWKVSLTYKYLQIITHADTNEYSQLNTGCRAVLLSTWTNCILVKTNTARGEHTHVSPQASQSHH